MKFRTLLILSALSFTLFVGANLISARLPNPIPESALAGKKVWQKNNCISCHALFGNGGYVADDLTHIVQKRSPSQVADFLVDPPVMRPSKYTKHPSLNRTEAKKLVEYLEFVQAIPTLGWPPQPDNAGGSP